MISIFETGSNISSLTGIAGFVIAAFFLIARQLLKKNIFPRLTRDLSVEIINKLIDRFFWLSVLSIALGFIGFMWSITVSVNNQHSYSPPEVGMIKPVIESGSSINLAPEPNMKNVVFYLKIIPKADGYTPISSYAKLVFDSDTLVERWEKQITLDINPEGFRPKVKSYLVVDTLLPRDKYLELIDASSNTRVKVVLGYDPDIDDTDIKFTSPWFNFNRQTIEEAQ